jgi:hypothetical protein
MAEARLHARARLRIQGLAAPAERGRTCRRRLRDRRGPQVSSADDRYRILVGLLFQPIIQPE